MEMKTILIIVLVVVTVILLVVGGIYLARKIKAGLASYTSMAKLYKQINQAKKKPAMIKPKVQRKKKPKRKK